MIKSRPLESVPPPSSRGPGRDPFKVKTGVRIPVGAQKDIPHNGVSFLFETCSPVKFLFDGVRASTEELAQRRQVERKIMRIVEDYL